MLRFSGAIIITFVLIFSTSIAQNSYSGFKKNFYESLTYKSFANTTNSDFLNLQKYTDEFKLKYHIRNYLSSYNYPDEHILLANYFDKKGDFLSLKMAIFILEWGINKFFENEQLKLYLAFLYEKASIEYYYNDHYRYEYRQKAVNVYRALIKTNKDNIAANYNLARLYADSLFNYNGYETVDHHTFFNSPEYNPSDDKNVIPISPDMFTTSISSNDSSSIFRKNETAAFLDVLDYLGKYKEQYCDYFSMIDLICRLYFVTDEFNEGLEYLYKTEYKIISENKKKQLMLWKGIFEYELKKYSEAYTSFHKAMQLMEENEKLDYTINSYKFSFLSRYGKSYNEKTISEKKSLIDKHLLDYEPLFLTEYNEAELEHFYRVAISNNLYSVNIPEQNIDVVGWSSPRGEIFLRYGRPLKIYDLRSPYGFNMEVWEYAGVKFIFIDIEESGEYIVADSEMIEKHVRYKGTKAHISFDDLIKKIPEVYYIYESWKKVEVENKFYQLRYDLYRNSNDKKILYVCEYDEKLKFQQLHLFKMDSLQNVQLIKNKLISGNANSKLNNSVFGEIKSDAETYDIALELSSNNLASIYSTKINYLKKLFSFSEADISDIVFAKAVEFNNDSYINRNGIGIFPLANRKFNNSDSLFIYFEVYNLKLNNKLSSYTKEIIIEKTEKPGFFDSIFMSLGLKSNPIIKIESTHQSQNANEQIYFNLDISNLDEGNYILKVKITDRNYDKILYQEEYFELVK